MSIPAGEITQLLEAWRSGNREALDSLVPIIYKELLRIAHRQLRQERHEHTLQSAALLHEAYVRLLGINPPRWEGRSHFFAIAAQLMRQILVDHARRHRSAKRGAGVTMLSIEDAEMLPQGRETRLDLLAVNDALTALARFDERKARVVEMRFFGGLNFDEIAEVLELSTATVTRDWSTARAWLHREMSGGG